MPMHRRALSILIAAAVLLLRLTCRTRLHNDPRAALRSHSGSYIYSVLHAHQIAAVINREPNTAAMVSQSADGQLLILAFRALGVKAVRGSSSTKRNAEHNKGGRAALRGLADHLRAGGRAYLAVDGPRGPRNRVNKGVAVLAKQTGAVVVNVVAVPTRRWILAGVWDRFQVPRPFSCVDGYFGEPLFIEPGEAIESFRQRVEHQLTELERRHDPQEAADAQAATAARVRRGKRSTRAPLALEA
ncbi:MAG: DUF374 domain-containing protein [Planctomycetota bacterium]